LAQPHSSMDWLLLQPLRRSPLGTPAAMQAGGSHASCHPPAQTAPFGVVVQFILPPKTPLSTNTQATQCACTANTPRCPTRKYRPVTKAAQTGTRKAQRHTLVQVRDAPCWSHGDVAACMVATRVLACCNPLTSHMFDQPCQVWTSNRCHPSGA
jgi:hypothetical protein